MFRRRQEHRRQQRHDAITTTSISAGPARSTRSASFSAP